MKDVTALPLMSKPANGPQRVKKTVGNGLPGPGRPAGVANKLTQDVKAMIIGALNDAGGQAYLTRQAEENPKAFMGLVGRVLPMAITDGDGGPLSMGSRIEVVLVSGGAEKSDAG